MANIFKKNRTGKTIPKVYLIAFFLLLISYLITLFANRQLIKQAGRVELANNIIHQVNDILANVKDGETGVRGYIMTKDIQFLFPYYGSKERADSHYHLVVALTKDNPVQQEKLTQLKNNVDKRFEQLKFLISAYNANNRERTDSMIKQQPAALKTMDEIRSSIFMIEREEKRQLAAQNEKLQRTFKTINTITIISLTLAFSLLFFGFITYMQVSKERRKGQQDITNYQNELTNRIDDLNKANAELIKMRGLEKFAVTGRIARTIGHEVRNPLTNIMLASSQLKSAMAEKEENTEYLFEMISRNSDRINQLVSDLLNSTKFSELTYEKTSINSLLNQAMREAEDRITLSNVKVVKKYSSDICDVTVDKEKIKIAFLNIIINALEAMENKDSSVLTLETKGGDKCTVIISDNGRGMDSESVNRLFEPYFTSKPNGNGLGLTNTQNIILAHKGDISVESTPGQGTSFIIKLDLIS